MFRVKKSLNNNVLIALDGQEKEVVLIGNGIGFHYKKKDIVDAQKVEKMFVLRDQQEQQQYKQLIPNVDEALLHSIISAIDLIRKRSDVMLNESVHVALTDHILFAVNRMMKGLEIKNPFLACALHGRKLGGESPLQAWQ